MTIAFQTIKRISRGVCYVILLAAAGGCIALVTAGFWLVPRQEPLRPADVIIVLAGSFERSLYAADLYQRGLAPKIWVSRPARERGARQLEELGILLPSEEDIHRRILLQKKVAPADVDFFGTGSLSTFEEARSLREKLGMNSRRLIIVTSPTHVLRARIIFNNALMTRGSNLQVVATPYDDFDVYWWRDQNSARAVILEFAKLAFYFCGGRFLSVANPV